MIKTTNKIAIARAKYLYPSRSVSTSLLPPAKFPRADTLSTVIILIIAEPTPAQDRARAERFSLSFPLLVKAGIMDQ